MPLVSDARATAVFNAVIANNPNSAKMSATEQQSMLAAFKVLYGADTTYLKGNTQVNPTSFAVPSGIAVSTTGSAAAQTGTTTAPGSVTGSGTIS